MKDDPAWLWLLAATAALGIFAADGVARLKRRRKELTQLRDNWGQPFRSTRNHRPLDATVAHFPEDDARVYRLDDATWADLELDDVVRSTDRTLTAIGAQTFYGWLRQPALDPEVSRRRRALADALSADDDVRVAVQSILISLGDTRGWDAAKVLAQPLPELWGARWIFFVLPLLPLFGIASGVALGNLALLVVGMAMALVNPIIHALASRTIGEPLEGIAGVRRVIEAALALSKKVPAPVRAKFPHLDDDLSQLRRSLEVRRSPTRTALTGNAVDLLSEYWRALSLSDIRAYFGATQAIDTHRDALKRVLAFVGQIDAALGLALLRRDEPGLRPVTWSDEPRTFLAVDLAHPALAHPVGNDVALAPTSLLVTGSNMAGKSTFLRTLGVNVVLAQALGLARAQKVTISPLRVIGSMHVHDDLQASVSLYQAEVTRVRTLLDQAGTSSPCLFLIDEMFRGTNPTERVAASAAVLLELAKCDLVVAATHDLALVDLTRPSFDAAHFAEHTEGDRVVFDYKLKPGITRRTNALTLLERLGYPAHVVALARELATRRDEPTPTAARAARPS